MKQEQEEIVGHAHIPTLKHPNDREGFWEGQSKASNNVGGATPGQPTMHHGLTINCIA